jgi:hypothetical protein
VCTIITIIISLVKHKAYKSLPRLVILSRIVSFNFSPLLLIFVNHLEEILWKVTTNEFTTMLRSKSLSLRLFWVKLATERRFGGGNLLLEVSHWPLWWYSLSIGWVLLDEVESLMRELIARLSELEIGPILLLLLLEWDELWVLLELEWLIFRRNRYILLCIKVYNININDKSTYELIGVNCRDWQRLLEGSSSYEFLALISLSHLSFSRNVTFSYMVYYQIFVESI